MSSKLPAGITLIELQKLAKLNEQIAKATAIAKQLTEKARPLFKPGTYAFEGVVVTVTAKTALDEAVFVADKPYEAFPELYKVSPDTKKVQALFGKEYYVEATPSMSVKAVK